jgi:hypothetical protein
MPPIKRHVSSEPGFLNDTDEPIAQEKLTSKMDWSAAVVTTILEPLLKRQAIMEIDAGYMLT